MQEEIKVIPMVDVLAEVTGKNVAMDGEIYVFLDSLKKVTVADLALGVKLQNEKQEAKILETKVNEALEYLARTDKKVNLYYDFEDGDDTLEQYIEARRIARKFVRDNQNV
jgi:glycerophosphoryl diester phosphodiesterase